MQSSTDSRIHMALIRARMSMGKLVKDAQNPHFRSNYATLTQCHDVAVPALAAEDIAVVEYVTVDERGAVAHLDLVHADTGEVINSEFPLVSKDANNPQAFGSAHTYARRYLIQAAAGLTPEDDDGNSASRFDKAKDNMEAKQEQIASALLKDVARSFNNEAGQTIAKCLWTVQKGMDPSDAVNWYKDAHQIYQQAKHHMGQSELDTMMVGYANEWHEQGECTNLFARIVDDLPRKVAEIIANEANDEEPMA